MTTGNDGDVMAAVVIQLAAHAEQLSELDSRESGHHDEAASQLRQLRERADTADSHIGALTAILGRHASAVKTLEGLDGQVAALARQIAELAARGEADWPTYQPRPAPQWWHLTEAQREGAVDRLRSWVEQIYRPGYGHHAAALPACWEQHQLCLYTLDWLCELWSVLYLSTDRSLGTLASQAEWQTRLLPAAASQMSRETAHCEHANGAYRRPLPRRPLPGHDQWPGNY